MNRRFILASVSGKSVSLLATVVIVLLALMAPSTPVGALSPPLYKADPEEVAPADFVALAYQDMLGRPADPGGLNYWASRLESGMSEGDLIEAFIDSQEVGGAYGPIIRLYRAAFLRPPDRTGLNYWVRVARKGVSSAQIASSFVVSAEFKNRYGSLSDTQFVDQIYLNVLGRPADPGGRSYWVNRIQKGLSRGGVLLNFAGSAENIKATSVSNRMSLLTVTMLRRIPFPTEISNWDSWSPTITTGELIALVMDSDEYGIRLGEKFDDRHPLTGQATEKVPDRPALAIKIDNVDFARPQTAINQADVVYEELVEGSLTRLVAIFHSRSPEVVGPVRSVRVSDFDILAAYNQPLLAASGANKGVLSALAKAPVINRNALVSPYYFRDTNRKAPHNLYTQPLKLWASAPSTAAGPPTMFITGRNPTKGVKASGIDINFGRAAVTWRWDQAADQWRRTQNGSAHEDVTGKPVGVDNLVVMATKYTPNSIDANSPEAHTVGEGRALIYMNGAVVDGKWRRKTATERIKYYDAKGAPVVFNPGKTWVELAPPGTFTIIG